MQDARWWLVHFRALRTAASVPAVWSRAWSRCCGPRCRWGHPVPSWWRKRWCRPARWRRLGDRKHGWRGSPSGRPTGRWRRPARRSPEPSSKEAETQSCTKTCSPEGFDFLKQSHWDMSLLLGSVKSAKFTLRISSVLKSIQPQPAACNNPGPDFTRWWVKCITVLHLDLFSIVLTAEDIHLNSCFFLSSVACTCRHSWIPNFSFGSRAEKVSEPPIWPITKTSDHIIIEEDTDWTMRGSIVHTTSRLCRWTDAVLHAAVS